MPEENPLFHRAQRSSWVWRGFNVRLGIYLCCRHYLGKFLNEEKPTALTPQTLNFLNPSPRVRAEIRDPRSKVYKTCSDAPPLEAVGTSRC